MGALSRPGWVRSRGAVALPGAAASGAIPDGIPCTHAGSGPPRPWGADFSWFQGWCVPPWLHAYRRTKGYNGLPPLLPGAARRPAPRLRGLAGLLSRGPPLARRRTRLRLHGGDLPGDVPSVWPGPRADLLCRPPAGAPAAAPERGHPGAAHHPAQAELLRLRDQRGPQGAPGAPPAPAPPPPPPPGLPHAPGRPRPAGLPRPQALGDRAQEPHHGAGRRRGLGPLLGAERHPQEELPRGVLVADRAPGTTHA